MNQQACLFIEDQKSLQDLHRTNTQGILNFSNKFRAFVFILKDHFEKIQEFEKVISENTVLPLNEILTQFLTYSLETKDPIASPIIVKTVSPYWVCDIDAFVSFPRSIELKLNNLGPHSYFYEDLKLTDRRS